METELTFKRWTGLAGVAGALLFFCGDMLFYGQWGSGATFHQGMLTVLQQVPRTRLFVGSLIGPVAACLYLIGCWHVRQNLIGCSPLLGRVVFLALAATMVVGSAVHALWVPRSLAIKYSDVVEALHPNWSIVCAITGGLLTTSQPRRLTSQRLSFYFLFCSAKRLIHVGQRWPTLVFFRCWHRRRSAFRIL